MNIVVEGAVVIFVLLQQPERVAVAEILELDEAVPAEPSDHRLHELVQEFVVFLTCDSFLPEAKVLVVLQLGGAVGADVEGDGQAVVGFYASQRGVEAEFADGDAHAVHALVADAQNALAVSDDDGPDVSFRPERRILQFKRVVEDY